MRQLVFPTVYEPIAITYNLLRLSAPCAFNVNEVLVVAVIAILSADESSLLVIVTSAEKQEVEKVNGNVNVVTLAEGKQDIHCLVTNCNVIKRVFSV